MKFSHIHFIINPASGREEAILSYINNVFTGTGTEWDISVTKKDKDTGAVARSLVGSTDLIAVYGGDGSVSEVAAALQGSLTPMAIIPGGTANVMAKELGIPQDATTALQWIASGNSHVQAVDMGIVNGTPFLLRVNLGLMADMVLQTSARLKNDIGQIAYGLTALKAISDAGTTNYRLTIDGALFQESGVSLTVTNSGNIGISDFALQPGISITDGLLDVILLFHADFSSLLKVAGSALLQSETDAVKHWKCREVTISLDKPQAFICDDSELTAAALVIKVVPAAIHMLTPNPAG